MIDQKHGKGNLSPIRGQVPQIDHGTNPSAKVRVAPAWLMEVWFRPFW